MEISGDTIALVKNRIFKKRYLKNRMSATNFKKNIYTMWILFEKIAKIILNIKCIVKESFKWLKKSF